MDRGDQMDTAPTRTHSAGNDHATTHPSAPLPEVGPPVAHGPRVPLGRTGLQVFPFALGTAGFGRIDSRAATAILDRYAESGGNAVHVTDRDADVLDLVGGWIHSRGVRDDILLSVRVGAPRRTRTGEERLAAGFDRVLGGLRAERVDVLTLDTAAQGHDATRLEHALAAAEPLVASDAVRSVGAYGLDATQLLEARVLASGGYPRIDVFETPYGLGDRAGFEGDLRRVVVPQRVAVMPVDAIPLSLLAHVPRPARAGIPRFRGRLMRALDAVSREAGLTAAATALAWVRAQRGVVAPVVDVLAVHHIDDLAPAATAELTSAQAARLDRIGSR